MRSFASTPELEALLDGIHFAPASCMHLETHVMAHTLS